MEHSDDPGRAFVVGAGQVELLDHLLVRGETRDRHRQGMSDVGDQRAEGDDHLHTQTLGRLRDAVGEGPPAQIRLGAGEQDQIALRAGRRAREQDVARPLDLAGLPLGHADRRAVGLEVEELLRVDLRDQIGVERLRGGGERGRGGAGGVIPAGECADENGGSEFWWRSLPSERVHHSRLASRRSRRVRLTLDTQRLVEATAASTRIAELRPGQRFSGVYACVRKDRLSARNGSIYLSMELRDRSGSIPARAFREVDRLAGRFERGDAISVAGRVERFRGELVGEVEDIQSIDPAELDPTDFLPAAYRDAEELEGFLEHLTREVHEPALRQVVERVLFSDPVAAEFRRAPCTRAGHHAYVGGLLEHTVAMGTLLLEVCRLHPSLDSDLLMAAALLHDVGKTREFTYGAEFGITEEGRLIGHLALGAEIIGSAAGELPAERRAALLNCVLSHHGADAGRGASGGRGFAIPEALALYRLNALDAGVKGALEQGL